jgi:hypothetical protein
MSYVKSGWVIDCCIVGLHSVRREIVSYVIIVLYDKVRERSVVDFSFEKDTIGHIFTGQYNGLQYNFK